MTRAECLACCRSSVAAINHKTEMSLSHTLKNESLQVDSGKGWRLQRPKGISIPGEPGAQ